MLMQYAKMSRAEMLCPVGITAARMAIDLISPINLCRWPIPDVWADVP